MSPEVRRALKTLPWILIPAGALLIFPFPLGLVRAFPPLISLSWILGEMLLVLPLAAIPFAALWTAFSSKSQHGPMNVMTVGFARYAPVLAVLFAQFYLIPKPGPSAAQAACIGALVLVYALQLLKRDAA
jgi:hypothetical protein